MNILQIGTTDNKGGAGIVSWQIKEELEKKGHKISMIVGYKRSNDKNVKEIFDTPINNFISKIIKRNFRARLHYNLSYNLANDINFLPGKKILDSPEFKKTDIVHCHNLHSDFFNLKNLIEISKYKPVVWTLHDMWALTGHCAHSFDCSKWQTGCGNCPYLKTIPAIRWDNTEYLFNLKKRIYKNSKLNIVVPSKWLAGKVKESILKNNSLETIYNGVPISNYQLSANNNQFRKELELPADKKIILFTSKGGKNNKWKGWEYAQGLIKKYKDNSNILFLCVGGYSDDHSQKNVRFIKYIVDKKLLNKYYMASDLLLYPALADNCPLTVIEAMSCGLPILTFATGGIPELVGHKKNGYIAEYKSQASLDSGFKWWLKLSPCERNNINSNCKQKVIDNFSLGEMTDKYLKLYQKLTANFLQ